MEGARGGRERRDVAGDEARGRDSRRRDLSSRDLLECYLDRIDRLGRDVNAVVTLDTERARASAAAADEVTTLGGSMGPLHGLPITIKDAIATEGIRSTGGAKELADHVPTEDAPAVARLKAAGAIVFGKTNLPKWSGDIQTYNELFGVSQQPVGARPHHRRLVGRRGRRGGRRVHQLRARHRHRRLGAHPVALLRRLRAQAHVGRDPAARVPRPLEGRHDRRRHQRVRPDRALAPTTSTSSSPCSPAPIRSARSRGASSCRSPRSTRSRTSTSACGSTIPRRSDRRRVRLDAPRRGRPPRRRGTASARQSSRRRLRRAAARSSEP